MLAENEEFSLEFHNLYGKRVLQVDRMGGEKFFHDFLWYEKRVLQVSNSHEKFFQNAVRGVRCKL